MQNVESKSIIDNSTQIYPDINNTYYGSNSYISISNPKTSYGVISTTIYNDGIKLISNSGLVLWEQYISDHPNLSSLTARFNMKIASAAVAEDQNALIVLTKSITNTRTYFYLISYDLGTGQPICDKTLNKQIETIVNTGGLNNNYVNEMAIAYNPLNQLVICYTIGQVTRIKNEMAIFSFNIADPARPFVKKTEQFYLNWIYGSAPHSIGGNDYLIDITIDRETGITFGTFQRFNGGVNNQKMYIIPFNSNFSSLRGSKGAWIPISLNTGNPTNFAPNYVFRNDKNNQDKGMIYGIYHHISNGNQKVYRYAIEVDTKDINAPFITNNITVNEEESLSDRIGIKIDENGNNVGYAINNNNRVTAKAFNYNGITSNYFTSTSQTFWENNNYNFTFTNEAPDLDSLKYVVSKPGYFEQSSKISNTNTLTTFDPIPIINLNYRSQFLGYSNSGSSKYPSEITDDTLKSSSEQLFTPGTKPQPILGNGLWGFFRSPNSFYLKRDAFAVSNVRKNDSKGTITFDISIPYVIGNSNFTNLIKDVKIDGFKSVISQTALNIRSVDVNRYNSVVAINDDGIPFREKRPDIAHVNADKIKSIIITLLNDKPYDIKPENIIFDETKIVSNYLLGTLTIPKISLNYYYDRFGVLTRGNLDVSNNFVIEGFYQSNQTFIDENNSFLAPRNMTASEFLDNENIHSIYLYNLIENTPIEFDFNRDFQFDRTIDKNIIINNASGTLTIKELYLSKWNDASGKLNETLSRPFRVSITNFINVSSQTTVRREYLDYKPDIQPSEITDNDIKQIIRQISLSLPEHFNLDDISFKSDPVRNNLDGTITVVPIFSKWYNNKGFLNTVPKEMGTITLKGYKVVQPTKFNDSWNIGSERKYASDFKNDKDYASLKKLIASNTENLPFLHKDTNQNFDVLTDIVIDENSIIFDNTNGSIQLNLKLAKYYDDKGIYHNDDSFPMTTITITGFRRIFGATSFDAVYSTGFTDVSPQNFTDTQIKRFLINYGHNIPINILDKNISFASVERIPIEGIIKVVPVLNLYYDNLGQPINATKTFPMIIMKDFRQINPTKFDEHRWILGTSNLVAEEVANNERVLKEILLRKIINAPNNFGANHIQFLMTPFFNNEQGTINVRVKLARYYDSKGFLRNDDNSGSFNLTITGFFIAFSRTNIPNALNVNYPYVIPQDINANKLKEILIDNFVNLPPSFKPENIILQNGDWQYYNIDGVIIIPSLKINYYFDHTLKIKRDIYVFPKITITGFKKIQPTVLPTSEWNIGDNKTIASSFTKNEDDIKKMIDSRILNKPSSFDYSKDITLSNLKVANELGAFRVSVTLKKYYDNEGKLSVYGWIPQDIVVSGFLIVHGETTFPTLVDSFSPTVEANSVKIDDIKKMLFNSLNNPPPTLTPDQIIIEENDISIDNKKGEITVSPTLPLWFDINKELQTNNKQFKNIKIYNFKKINQTTINNFWDYGDVNLVAEEVVKNTNTLKKFIYNNISNKPSNFTYDNIVINSKEHDNIKGTITVKFVINSFYDFNGILQTSGFPEYTAVITGYRNISATVIPTTGWTIGDPVRLASDFLIPANQPFIKELVYSRILNLPNNYDFNNIQLLNINSNNILGSLTFDVKVKGGYATNGNVDNEGESNNLNANITISGFKNTFATTFNKDIKIPNVANLYPQFFENDNQKIKELIFTNRQFIFKNLPSGFLPTDIIEASLITADNKKGALSIKLSIKNYFSVNNGNLINDANELLTENITLYGFYASAPTIFNDQKIYIQGLDQHLATDYNSDPQIYGIEWMNHIKKYQDIFFKNLPPYFDFDNNINNISIIENNNIDGSCVINVSLKGYFKNDNLSLIEDTYNDIQFTVYGFKTLNSTAFNQELTLNFLNITINSNQEMIAANSLLASDIFYNISSVQIDQIIKENRHLFFNYLPANFSDNNIKRVQNVSYNNLKGELVVDVTIDNYYSDKGILINDQELTKQFKILGFKQIKPTTYNDQNMISSLSDVVATELKKEEIVDIIYNNRSIIFNNTLPNVDLYTFKDYFTINSFSANNYDSMLKINANLYIYYDDNGNLIKDKNKPKTINLTLRMFKQLNNETKIRSSVWIENSTNILVSNAIREDDMFLYKTIINNKNKVFENIPNDLLSSDFNISNVKWNNNDGKVTMQIQLNKYYDKNGILITRSSNNFKPIISTITLYGYQKIVPTSIGNISLENATSSIYIEASIGDSLFLPSYYQNIDIIDAETQLYNLVISKLFNGSINNIQNQSLSITDFSFDPHSASDETNSLVVSFTISNFITVNNGLVISPTSVTLKITDFGGYKEETLSKDTIYYITAIATIYLSTLSGGIIAYIIYKLVRWSKGRM